ncbi:MGDG synthase family glycosyltransferase [Desmospora profundinema]|uniref:Processive 1,2-diacylglycerol beta-glucosyltransferase n=1 Tax=Desmospora profundinema TaxID=1571184 RepID=A0ABU1IME5_9BACL|nr:glycosyltransferase [Desmospora profundinema]MDR6224950.1 processive 1,2-diacylglycerol beta-glucosyltransferase [Desmospora profundinema]
MSGIHVMILTETVGGNGHFRAADAIRAGIKRTAPDVKVQIQCGLSHFSPSLERIVRQFYLGTLRYAPGLWGAAYQREQTWSEWFQTPLGELLSTKLLKLLEEQSPDVVVCTHAFCLGAMGQLKERHRFDFRLGAAVTDFDANGFWIHPAVDFYLLAHESVAEKIHDWFGVPRERLHVTGIPIDPCFTEDTGERAVLREQLGIAPEAFTVLLMGGGVGLGPLEKVVKSFRLEMPNEELVVVTGRNQRLLERLSARYDQEPGVHILGYTQRMRDWMKVSDLIVSKAGGLTSSEALATGLPMMICQPIPGQEERNSRFLTHHRVALRQDRPGEIPRHIHPLMKAPERWDQMRQRAKGLGKPGSALDAAGVILKTN